MKQASFEIGTREEARTIHQIALRAVGLAKKYGFDYSLLTVDMDLTACHCNGCRLRLNDLLAADELNFAHDVFGIRRHIDRETGELKDCFLPRFAEPQQQAA